jgi:hypothetical protein
MPKLIGSDLDFNSATRLINLPNPTLAQHAATKAYVDSAVEGLAWKDSVRVSTQANLNLASPGATIDGITMATNDRILVRLQTLGQDNGLYIFNGSATPATRALDANTADELEQAVVTVEEGTNAGSTFRQTAVNFTLGTTVQTWASFGTSAPAASETVAGIIEIATQAETNAGASDLLAITPLKLATYTGLLRRAVLTFGDGSATQYTHTHNLNTDDVQAEVYRTTGNKDSIIVDTDRISVNAVRYTFAVAPTSNQFRSVVIG